ncbi:hypothetical protein ACI2JA_15600 [Alkalihalobacillus sp. NPDC078783]
MNEKALEYYIAAHNKAIEKIQITEGPQARIEDLTPVQMAKLEYEYAEAERQAYRIASYYKSQQKYHEAMAEIEQGKAYERVVIDGGGRSADGQYLSRKFKGEELKKAGKHEGDYMKWRGVAVSYERAANSLKDMIKARSYEDGTGR